MEEDIISLTHTKWRCQYHLAFAPKYRRKIIYGKYKVAIGKIIRRIVERMDGVEIIEANACEDHIHMLVTIPPKMSVSKFMGILKGKSSYDIRSICEFEIQVWKQTFLASGLLCGYHKQSKWTTIKIIKIIKLKRFFYLK